MVIAVATLLASSSVSSREPASKESVELPSWAAAILNEKRFASTYALSTRLDPYFLEGDFNGDHRPDLAVLIERKQTKQQGIAFLHAGARNPIVVGAGRAIGNGGPDFSWLDTWSIVARSTHRENSPALRGDALLVEKRESASALLYWDGAAYRWRQQGD
jgi:hypothetical protein